MGGDGSDKSEVDVSNTEDDTSVKKKRRQRKQRGLVNRAKFPSVMTPEDRPIFLRQKVGEKSENGRISFPDIDWVALADGLTNFNGTNPGSGELGEIWPQTGK